MLSKPVLHRDRPGTCSVLLSKSRFLFISDGITLSNSLITWPFDRLAGLKLLCNNPMPFDWSQLVTASSRSSNFLSFGGSWHPRAEFLPAAICHHSDGTRHKARLQVSGVKTIGSPEFITTIPECLTGKNLACVQAACKSQHKNRQFKVQSFVGFELCKEDSTVGTSGRMGYKSSKHLATWSCQSLSKQWKDWWHWWGCDCAIWIYLMSKDMASSSPVMLLCWNCRALLISKTKWIPCKCPGICWSPESQVVWKVEKKNAWNI